MSILMWIGIFVAVFIGVWECFLSYYLEKRKINSPRIYAEKIH
ncbi:Uncharacterised protein [Staphylococcus saprophyticus]|nr:Uncharacterised protein [Staphylococcus saprophyticus]